MPQVVRTHAALKDLIDIAAWIAQYNGFGGFQMVDRIDMTIEELQMFPLMGHSVEFLGAGMRRITKDNYVIYYRFCNDSDLVQVSRVVYRMRDIDVPVP